jgi:peptide/nickel transport system permease protein
VLFGGVLRAVGTVVGAATLLLVGLELAPGSPADLVPDASVKAVLDARWGLDRPVWERVLGWFVRAASGDLGTSFAIRPGAPVTELLGGALARTVPLLALATPLTLALAHLPARLRAGLLLLSAVPVFLLGHLVVEATNAMTWQAMVAGWIGRPVWFALPAVEHPVRTALAALVLAIGSNLVGDLAVDLGRARSARRRSDFAAVARVHGSGGPSWRHAVLDAIPIGLSRLPVLLGGTVVLKRVFLVQGAGNLLWQAALERDFELAMALALLAAVVVAGVGLAAEIATVALDPRRREVA